MAERLRVYARQTQPVLSYYSDAGLLRTVRAEGALEDITQRLLDVLTVPAKKAAKPPVKRRAPSDARPRKRKPSREGPRSRAAKGEGREAPPSRSQSAAQGGSQAWQRARRSAWRAACAASQSAASKLLADDFLAPAAQQADIAPARGELLELAARREHFGADFEALRRFCRDVGQAFHQRDLRRIRALAARQRRAADRRCRRRAPAPAVPRRTCEPPTPASPAMP